MTSIYHYQDSRALRAFLSAAVITSLAMVWGAQTVSALSVTLDPGDSGAAVTELQQFLAADSSIYPEGLVTGYYGSLTVAAVQRYQCREGIVCSGTPATTGYGRVGPSTLAHIEGGVMTGGSSSGDVSAPILSQPVATVTSTSATITWGASEPSTNIVRYSTVTPALNVASFAAMPSVPASSGLAPGVTITGLLPNTTYYFVAESVDASGNVQYDIENSFHTAS